MPSRSKLFDHLDEPQRRGDATEAILIAEFCVRGFTVLTPVQDNEAYDFVVEMDGEFFRFQAKTAYESKNEGTFRFETRSTRVKNQGYEREGYDGKIDYFAVYHPETDGIYVVPIHEVPENQMAIRYEEAPPGYESGVNWYEDYLLDHFV